jgi:hypothetical protein
MRYYQHPVEIFIAKQSELVKKGLSEEEAFATCAQEKEAEEAALQTERELSKQQVSLDQICSLFAIVTQSYYRAIILYDLHP